MEKYKMESCPDDRDALKSKLKMLLMNRPDENAGLNPGFQKLAFSSYEFCRMDA
jgi:hypothetical protein